ncbi:MAG: 16S rRNA (guanine(527)-N(7))-methyltransferase RsmG [Bdellovibrionia bacterium]
MSMLTQEWPGLSTEAYQRITAFRDWVIDESTRQNLTKLLAAREFFEGHVLDVKALLECKLVDFPAMDLGSGGGVPGFLAALVSPDRWVLADSEGHKAAFLARSIEKFGLSGQVEAFSGRAEKFLGAVSPLEAPKSIVARAVGPVERIYTWIRPCSTWNNLVLLKGPRWEEEWSEFQSGRYRNELKWVDSFKYVVGAEKKQRIIVKIERVPRGTHKKA